MQVQQRSCSLPLCRPARITLSCLTLLGAVTSGAASAQGRLVGEGQTLDGRAYGLPEQSGAVAAYGGFVLSSTVTSVPAGGDHAQLFGELTGAQQLYPVATFDAVGDGNARAFGSDVALGAGRLMVSDPGAPVGALQGRVDSWSLGALGVNERATLTPPEPGCAAFGARIDCDGARLAVLSRAQGADAVRCFLYAPDGGGAGWSLADRIAVPEEPGDPAVFGERVALDGNRVVLGAPWRAGGRGAALVYVASPTTGVWQLAAELQAPGLATFGTEVALAGEHLLVGGSESFGLASRGVVVAFRRVGGVWTEVQRLLPPESGAWDQFGAAIALRSGVALIASAGRSHVGGADGSVDVWTLAPLSNVWSRQCEIVHTTAHAGDQLGLDVALDLSAIAPRVALAAKIDGRVQALSALLPTPLPARLELRSTAGVTVCAPNAVNSRGTWAKLRGLGSSVISRNNMTLEAWDLSPSAWIVLGATDHEACTPLGPIGSLALNGSGSTARWTPQPSNPAGVARIGVNLFGFPTSPSTGTVPVMSGVTWVFQGMYRDPLGGRLTEAIRVTFE
ncbi:MAG: hypothetical protein R3F49_18490 [Planctomycetota bacterium]